MVPFPPIFLMQMPRTSFLLFGQTVVGITQVATPTKPLHLTAVFEVRRRDKANWTRTTLALMQVRNPKVHYLAHCHGFALQGIMLCSPCNHQMR